MYVVLQPSPVVTHKLRVLLPNKKTIDFGSHEHIDYTDHRNPELMRAHLLRHGAQIPKDVRIETDPYEIHKGMLYADTSTEENWDDPFRAGYWERWVLWSYPSVEHAKLWMTMRKGILFMPTEEMLWFYDDKKTY
jgi:hypothetical protein